MTLPLWYSQIICKQCFRKMIETMNNQSSLMGSLALDNDRISIRVVSVYQNASCWGRINRQIQTIWYICFGCHPLRVLDINILTGTRIGRGVSHRWLMGLRDPCPYCLQLRNMTKLCHGLSFIWSAEWLICLYNNSMFMHPTPPIERGLYDHKRRHCRWLSKTSRNKLKPFIRFFKYRPNDSRWYVNYVCSFLFELKIISSLQVHQEWEAIIRDWLMRLRRCCP